MRVIGEAELADVLSLSKLSSRRVEDEALSSLSGAWVGEVVPTLVKALSLSEMIAIAVILRDLSSKLDLTEGEANFGTEVSFPWLGTTGNYKEKISYYNFLDSRAKDINIPLGRDLSLSRTEKDRALSRFWSFEGTEEGRSFVGISKLIGTVTDVGLDDSRMTASLSFPSKLTNMISLLRMKRGVPVQRLIFVKKDFQQEPLTA